MQGSDPALRSRSASPSPLSEEGGRYMEAHYARLMYNRSPTNIRSADFPGAKSMAHSASDINAVNESP